MRKLHIYLDNACSTNKNQYTLGWAGEMVEQGKFDIIRVSFLIAGHTKFSPDILYSKISQTFLREDVFTTEEFDNIAGQYVIDEGEKVCQWRSSLSEKYSALPGIRSLHDFIFARNPGSHVKLKVHPLCYTGPIEACAFHVNKGHTIVENVIPNSELSYRNAGQIRSLSDTKLTHLRQMFDNFIPRERRMPLLD